MASISVVGPTPNNRNFSQPVISEGSSIELPYDREGRVDWNTLGNILTAYLLGEVLCASYVDPKHGVKDNSVLADTKWAFTYEKDDIVVLGKQSTRTCFMGRGVVDVPLHEIAHFVKNIDSTYVWDRFLVEARYLKLLSETETSTDYIGYQRYETTQCFTTLKRDMLYFVRCGFMNGKYVQTAMSVEDPDYPVSPGITRVDAHKGNGFVLEQYEGNASKTLVSYLGNVNMKDVPQLVLLHVLKNHPFCAIRYIRSHFSQTKLSSSSPT